MGLLPAPMHPQERHQVLVDPRQPTGPRTATLLFVDANLSCSSYSAITASRWTEGHGLKTVRARGAVARALFCLPLEPKTDMSRTPARPSSVQGASACVFCLV